MLEVKPITRSVRILLDPLLKLENLSVLLVLFAAVITLVTFSENSTKVFSENLTMPLANDIGPVNVDCISTKIVVK